MRKVVIIILSLFCSYIGYCQDLSNIRVRSLTIIQDSIFLDSLSIVPGSFHLYNENESEIPDSLYSVDFPQSILLAGPGLRNRTLILHYRVFPLKFSESHSHKYPVITGTRPEQLADPFRISSEDLVKAGYYGQNTINRRGSLSRGIVFGNNQDVVVNSNLNLQLNGKISDDLNLVAAISDNNIPIQPEGYSQQIHEFDRVYISLFNEKMNLTAGDFELEGPPGEFMTFYKKAKGVNYSGSFDIDTRQKVKLMTSLSGAISKGNFCRNQFNGTEGNQGPYKLRGCNQEQFIIILAGSEKVFIDGVLMTRGLENDYVMDYNTAEISFTPGQMITKDKRIIVEFEYSERSYARFLLYNSNEFITEKGSTWLNVYSETDDRNQSIQQDLSESDRIILALAGDDPGSAVVARADSVGFTNNEVLYKKADTLAPPGGYQSIYVYSTSPDSAFYRLGFSFVGERNGNYQAVNSTANGKVYRWVAPQNGVPAGSYEPVVLLISPKKKQVVSAGGDRMISKRTHALYEASVSNNDFNTYSSLDSDDNVGYALKAGLDQDFFSYDTSLMRLSAGLRYRYVSRDFNPVERFRPVEFDRDWNLSGQQDQQDEHMLQVNGNFFRKDIARAGYSLEHLRKQDIFSAWRNNISGEFRPAGFDFSLKGSLLSSEHPATQTRFLRHRIVLSRDLFKLFKIGLGEETEDNRWNDVPTDSLQPGSFRFNVTEAFIRNTDSSKNHFFVSYLNRKDYRVSSQHLRAYTNADDIRAGFDLLSLPNSQLSSVISYRSLKFTDTGTDPGKPENSLISRLEYSLRLFRNALSSSTFYEIGSGLETKKEFSYIEVAPGQGVYTWSDYNSNDVRELDEFDVARFQDQASFIRVFIPTDDFINVYTNRFNQAINFDPSRLWKDKEGFLLLLSRFSNQFAYRLDRKNTAEDFIRNANPFLVDMNSPELVTIATSLRNQLSFNRLSKVFSMDYIIHRNNNRLLLANGFDTRSGTNRGLRVRWSLNPTLSLVNESDAGSTAFASEYFSSRDYRIRLLSNDVKLHYQPGLRTRFVLNHKLSERENLLNAEQARENTLGTELRYGILNKGTLNIRLNYTYINYSGEMATPVSYELLQALQPGKNAGWSMQFQRELTGGIELNVDYSGRVSENQAVIHTGGLQVRANF